MTSFSKPVVLLVVGIVLAHVLATELDHSFLIVNVLLTLTPMIAALGCFWCGQWKRSLLADKWRLFGTGVLLWATGQGFYTYSTVLMHRGGGGAVPADFWFLAYGVFLLLSTCIVCEGPDVTPIVLADGMQAGIAIILIYVTLFMNGHAGRHALPDTQLSWVYFAENAAIAVCATLRVIAKPRGQERDFHICLCAYAWLMLLVCTTLIYVNDFVAPTDGKLIEVFWLLPFLAVLALIPKPGQQSKTNPLDVRGPTWPTTLVYNLNPMFFTTCVILLGVHLAQQRPSAGRAAVVAALLIYSFRACVLLARLNQSQIRLRDSQASLRKLNDNLIIQSQTDSLTGAANRRHFHEVLGLEWNRALRSSLSLSVIMIDLDYFKGLNDRHGHAKGDEAIVMTAIALRGCLRRGGELLARYGGEEFVAVLPSTEAEQAMYVAEAMRSAIASLNILNNASHLGLLTVSIGACSLVPTSDTDPEFAVEIADSALYRAKAEGRNRSVLGDMRRNETPPRTVGDTTPHKAQTMGVIPITWLDGRIQV